MTATASSQTIVQGCPSTMGDDFQLNTTTLIRHAARTYGEQEIVYRTPDGATIEDRISDDGLVEDAE